MARASSRVARARRYIQAAVAGIADPRLRQAVREMLAAARGSGSSVRSLAAPGVRDRLDCTPAKLAAALPYDPTWAAPAAGPKSHHCYPGGWALHTAINVRAALSLARDVEETKQIRVDKESLVAAHILHDWAKLKLLVWSEEHALDADQGAGHHILALAESMMRDLPPAVVRLMAGVHSGWWREPDAVRRHLTQAADLIGLDLPRSPYGNAVGAAGGEGGPDPETWAVEGWIAHQAEASWYTATRRAFQELQELVEEWHRVRGVEVALARVRNLLFTEYDEMRLIDLLGRLGSAGLFAFLDAWLTARARGARAPGV